MKEGEVRLYQAAEILKKINTYSSIGFFALDIRCKELVMRGTYGLQARSVNPYNSSFEMLTQD